MFNGAWKESKETKIILNIPNKLITTKSTNLKFFQFYSKIFDCFERFQGLNQVFASLYRDEIEIEPSEVIPLLATSTLLQLVKKILCLNF